MAIVNYGGQQWNSGQGGFSTAPSIYDSDVSAANVAGQWGYKNAQEAAAADRYASDAAKYGQNLQYDLGKSQLTQEGDQWNQKYGLLSGLLSGGGGQSSYSVGGQNTAQSPINTNPIWNAQQIQGRVNATRAQNDASAGGEARSAAQKLAGQGFAASSPILAALQSQIQGRNRATNTGAENDIRWNAAEGNAAHVLDAQKALEQQWADWNNADIERRKTETSYQNQLIAALSGL